MRAVKILMLTDFYPPLIGGVERYVRNLGIELTRRGHDVAVATLRQGDVPAYAEEGGVRVYRIPGAAQRAAALFSQGDRRFAPPLPDPEATRALRDILARERPRVVHAHNWMVHSFLPLKRWSRAKLVLTLHDYSLACAKKTLVYGDGLCSGPSAGKCLRCAAGHYGPAKGIPTFLANASMSCFELALVDKFTAISRAVACGNRLRHDLEYEVIPTFVPDDVARWRSESDAYMAQLPGEGYIMFAGALSAHKGIHVLLDAYRRLDSPPPLVLIGMPRADTPVELPPGVVLLENWPPGAVMQAWRRSIVGVVPSVWPEPFGMVAVEAMANGSPVLASNVGGLAEIVSDGETGLLVPPGDGEALSNALKRLLANPDLRERMGAAGPSRARQFQASAVVPRIERVYRNVVRGIC